MNLTIQTVTPTHRAIVLVNFANQVGYRVIFKLKHKNTPIPFGTIATLTDKPHISTSGIVVDDNQQLYLSGVPAQGQFTITTGNNNNHYRCLYSLPNETMLTKAHKITVTCHSKE